VAGRVDHKGEETVLLADSVWAWEDALALGEEGFTAVVAHADRSRRNGRNGPGPSGNGRGGSIYAREPVGTAVSGHGVASASSSDVAPTVRMIPKVSPLRGSEVTGTIELVIGADRTPRPPEPRAEPSEPASVAALDPDHGDEPPWPDEARRTAVAADRAETQPLEASPGRVLHIRFHAAAQEHVLLAFEDVRKLVHEHPGETSVVLHIPAGGGREQAMQLRSGVAYDAELVAALRRRLGDGAVDVRLA
jgi:hypothetical protein